MKKRCGVFLALAATGGALYFAMATSQLAQAEPEAQSAKPAKKPLPHLKHPAVSRHMETLPPLTKLELKSLPPSAIPMEFNGGTVYWIPLDEKFPAKTKTRAEKTRARRAS